MTRGSLWVVGGVILGLILAVALLAVTRLRGTLRSGSPSPVLTIIPLPTATTPAIPTTTPPPLPSPTHTAQSDAPKQFSIGELVQVSGTEGGGLRIRESPSLTASVIILGLESEVFEVIEGPIGADGYTWWHLANPFDPSKQGWAADQFLRSLEDGS